MKKGYRIQIIPLGTGKARSFTLRRWQSRLLLLFFFFLTLSVLLFAFHQTRIALMLSTTRYLEEKNRELIAENSEYQEALSILDSVLEEQKRFYNIGRILLAPVDSVPELKQEESAFLTEEEIEQHIARFERDSTYNEGARPVIKPVIGVITQPWKEGEHNGVDLAAPLHDPVYATAPGIVTQIQTTSDLGLTVIIDHGEGYQTLYAHLGRTLVKKGNPVYRGSPIGTIGMTGNTSGPHLHYEVHVNGKPDNPALYFSD